MLRRWKPWEGSRSPIMLPQLKVCLWDWELPRTVSKPRLMLGTTGLFRPSEARSQPLCSLVASPVIQLLHVAFPTYCILVIDFWFKWVDFPGGSDGEASAYSAGDPVSVSGSGRSPGEGSGPHSSALAWKIPRTEEPGGLLTTGSQRARQDWAAALSFLLWLGWSCPETLSGSAVPRSAHVPSFSGSPPRLGHQRARRAGPCAALQAILRVHAQSCLTLCSTVDCSPPLRSARGIFQARTLEWGAISVSGESSWPRRRAPASCLSCTGSLILCHQHHLGSPGPN